MAGAIGWLLRPMRAGTGRALWADPALAEVPTLELTSEDFEPDGPMPAFCAGPGAGINRSPQLSWSAPPADTRRLALTMEDPDAPLPRPVVHLAVLLPAEVRELARGALDPADPHHPTGAAFLPGSFGRRGYSGPRPIVGHGPHHYYLTLCALDVTLDPPPGSARDLAAAASGHVLAVGRLTGTYERPAR